ARSLVDDAVPPRRSSDLRPAGGGGERHGAGRLDEAGQQVVGLQAVPHREALRRGRGGNLLDDDREQDADDGEEEQPGHDEGQGRSDEDTSERQSYLNLVG